MLVENCQFEPPPTLFGTPLSGWLRWNFARIFSVRTVLESLLYRVVFVCVILCLAVLV